VIKAGIFDMDGLLIDSEPLWRRAEREVFAGVGLELGDADCRQTTGLRADEVVAYWYGRSPWSGDDPARVLDRLERRVVELIRSEGKALPGARRAVENMRRAGIRLALASSSSHEVIEAVLVAVDLGKVFEVVASGADEARGKPDPAVYLTALRRLGLAAAECVAFEDSAAGVAAAKAAGLFTVTVPDRCDADDPRFDLADLKLRSLLDFELGSIGL
jgi:sugar-phosphatase